MFISLRSILEFIVSDGENGSLNCVEVDLHHYKQMVFNGRKAMVLSFYSGRAYGDEIAAFIQSIPSRRAKWYEELGDLKLNPRFPME